MLFRSAKELAGKEAIFACTVKAVRVKELPAIDDEFVKDISEFDTLAEYKADVKKRLVEEAKRKAEREYEDALVEKIVDASEVEIADAMINEEVEYMLHDFEHRLAHQGLRFDDYLKYVGMTKEQVAEEYKPQAEKTVKVRLVMEEIVKTENIGIEDGEIDARIEKLAEESSRTVEEVKKTLNQEYVNYIVNSVLSEKLMNFLKAANEGVVEEKKPAKADGEKKPAAKKPAAKKTAAADDTKTEEKKPAAKKSAKSAEPKQADAE